MEDFELEAPDSEITILLESWRAGNQQALADLMPLLYANLRNIAAGIMNRERAGHTLSPTAVVHEAYVRLRGASVEWQDRGHFLAIAAREMRRVLVDHARAAKREKRGGDLQRVTLTGVNEAGAVEADMVNMLAVEAALEKLSLIDPRKTEVVDLMLFGGLGIQEIADTLKVSVPTINRDWKFARAFLQHELKNTEPE